MVLAAAIARDAYGRQALRVVEAEDAHLRRARLAQRGQVGGKRRVEDARLRIVGMGDREQGLAGERAHARRLDVDDGVLMGDGRDAGGQVEPHQRIAVPALIGQQPKPGAVRREPHRPRVLLPIQREQRLPPRGVGADALEHARAGCLASDACADHAVVVGHPREHVARVVDDARPLARGQRDPMEIGQRGARPVHADDDVLGVGADDLLDERALTGERREVPRPLARALRVGDEDVRVLVAIPVLAVQDPPAVLRPDEGLDAPARVRVERHDVVAVQAPDVHGETALRHADPGQPRAVRRDLVVVARVPVGEEGLEGNRRRRHGGGRGRARAAGQEQQRRAEPPTATSHVTWRLFYVSRAAGVRDGAPRARRGRRPSRAAGARDPWACGCSPPRRGAASRARARRRPGRSR